MKNKALTLTLWFTLLLLGAFSLIHSSLRLDLERQFECDDSFAIPKCNVDLQKIYMMLITSICTIVAVILQVFKMNKLLLVNSFIGSFALLSLSLYFAAVLASDNFQRLGKI